jgi:hypothetical protein
VPRELAAVVTNKSKKSKLYNNMKGKNNNELAEFIERLCRELRG